MKTLYTGGTFDLLHFGHFSFLRQCRTLAERVIVSLNTDEFIEEFKGAAPILSYDERREGLLRCQYVDGVVANVGGADSKPAIEEVKPDIIAVGDDWVRKDYYAKWGNVAEAFNIQAEFDPVVAIARGGQWFKHAKVKEKELKAYGHSASHDPKVWKDEKLGKFIGIPW